MGARARDGGAQSRGAARGSASGASTPSDRTATTASLIVALCGRRSALMCRAAALGRTLATYAGYGHDHTLGLHDKISGPSQSATTPGPLTSWRP